MLANTDFELVKSRMERDTDAGKRTGSVGGISFLYGEGAVLQARYIAAEKKAGRACNLLEAQRAVIDRLEALVAERLRADVGISLEEAVHDAEREMLAAAAAPRPKVELDPKEIAAKARAFVDDEAKAGRAVSFTQAVARVTRR